MKDLIDAGIKLELVREVFTYLKENLGEDVTSANLVISGNKSVLVKRGEEIIDLLQNAQGVLNILPLSNVKEEIDAAIVELHPEIDEQTININLGTQTASGN